MNVEVFAVSGGEEPFFLEFDAEKWGVWRKDVDSLRASSRVDDFHFHSVELADLKPSEFGCFRLDVDVSIASNVFKFVFEARND